MTPREILYFLLLVICVGAGIFGITKVKSWYDASRVAEQQGRTLEATVGINADGVAADGKRAERDEGLARARGEFNQRYKEDERHEPAIADRSDRAVPQRVRDNFQSRRLARERLGCAGEQCRQRLADDDATER